MCRVLFHLLWLVTIILFLHGFFAWNACADDIRFTGDLKYQNLDTKNTNKVTGQETHTKSYSFQQQYNLNFSKTLYPYLKFDGGTLFEYNQYTSKTEGTKSETDERLLRPFVNLRLNNPIYQAAFGYTRTELHTERTNIPNTEDLRDQYEALLGWNPVELPQLALRYNYTHVYNDPKTQDLVEKLLTFTTNYTALRGLVLNYSYTRTETENRLTGFDTLDQSHFGKIEYAENFWEQRLSFNTSYRINYNTFELTGVPSGAEAQAPLFRFQGLFSQDNTPEDGPALSINNLLIDGNLIASTGIDIGLGGDELSLTNIGVDLGDSVNVSQIAIWVDRRLTGPVANSFSWSVYTSPDNINSSTWTLVATVSPAPFGTFDNVFTISFSEVNTRFIKIVTRPLDPGIPDAPNFPNIFVTEMEVFRTVSGGALFRQKQETINSIYELNLNARVTDRTTLGYNFSHNYLDRDQPSTKRTQLSNTISVNHVFNEVFRTVVRFNRFDTLEEDFNTVDYNYSASITAAYLSTFNQSLTFSGSNLETETDSSDNYSIILRNNAILYEGWSAILDSGFSWNRPEGSNTTEESILLRANTNVQPNRMLTFNFDYLQREIIEPEKSSRYDITAQAFFVPFRALSFNARYNVVKRSGSPSTTLQNYTVNWSPFRDGALQLFFNYNETLQSSQNQRDRSVGPGFSWTISNHFFLEMNYRFQKNDSDTQKTEGHNIFGEFRLVF